MEKQVCGKRRGHPLLPGLAALTLAACATAPAPRGSDGAIAGQVAFESVVPPGASRLELREGESFVQGLPAANRTLPTYPGRWLDRRLAPISVCADLLVDEGGRVYEVLPLLDGADCPTLAVEYAGDFNDAVAKAAAQWDFLPSYFCEPIAGVAADAECRSEGSKRPTAIRLGYRFVFRHTAQGASVSENVRVGD